MAKPAYKVWVVNQITLGTKIEDPSNRSYYYTWDQAKLDKVVSELKALFDEVCKHPNSKFSAADVESKDLATVAGSIKDGQLLIRLTRATKSESAIIKKHGNTGGNGNTVDTAGSGVISEAWLESAAGGANHGELLARLAFHELMHNKLDAAANAPKQDIHTEDGTGLAVSPPPDENKIVYNTALSTKNKANMAPQLGSIVQQFTGTTIP